MSNLPKKLLIATKNQGKVNEIIVLFKNENLDIDVKSLNDLKIYDDYEETGTTFESNAIGKSQFYSKLVSDRLTIADDSGLMVDALNGEPGVYSARYSGVNATDNKNNEKLLKELKNIEDRTAKFKTVVSISLNGKLIKTFHGEVKGKILTTPRGNSGFGYDPLFYYTPLKKTFGELSIEIKNNISHRAKAVKQMINFFKEL